MADKPLSDQWHALLHLADNTVFMTGLHNF